MKSMDRVRVCPSLPLSVTIHFSLPRPFPPPLSLPLSLESMEIILESMEMFSKTH